MRRYVILVYPDLAERFGINRAAVLSQLYYLTNYPPVDAERDGEERVWIRRSYQQWRWTFRWLSASGIRKIFDYLRQAGFVEAVASLYENSYALTEAGLQLFDIDDDDPDDFWDDEDADTELPAGMVAIVIERPGRPDPIQTEPSIAMSASASPVSMADMALPVPDSPPCPSGSSVLYNKRDSKEEDSLSPEHAALLEAFCDVCELNPRLKSHYNKVVRHVRELWEAGYCAADMECVHLYWKNDDYRTGRIYPKQVVEIVEAAVRKYRQYQPAMQPGDLESSDNEAPAWQNDRVESEIEDGQEQKAYAKPQPEPQLSNEEAAWWRVTQGALEMRLGQPTFRNWIENLKCMGYAENTLRLKTRAHKCQYLHDHIAHLIAAEYHRMRRCEVNKIIFEADDGDPVVWVSSELPKQLQSTG